MNPTTQTYPTHVNLEASVRGEMIGLLNQQLADASDLYSQVKQAHWNVKGIHFMQLHELFDTVAAAVLPFVDLMAERVTALGGVAMGTTRMAAANSTLPEFPGDAQGGDAFLQALVERVGMFANSSRQAATTSMDAGDEATADVFIEITREMDKMLYFLESHIQ